ncbi:MAG: hypothetical protein CMQ13_08320 [Gammaproteobacteria bacterium]|nr:hypothetical protein [Gammaproteobacteria bacterium]
MLIEQFLPLWAFIVLMVGTPGPANLLVMSAGAQVGLRASLPFILGLIGGKLLLNLAMVFGLGALLGRYPTLGSIFAWVSAGYMSWLALRGWYAQPNSDHATPVLGLRQGLLVHPLNPKAWVMTTLAFSQFGTGFNDVFQSYALIPLSFAVAQLLLHSAWCVAGAVLRTSIGSGVLLNRSLILLTIATVTLALLWPF